MDLQTACAEFEAGKIHDVFIEPADKGNGWMICVHDSAGRIVNITNHGGREKIYHTIDHATEVAKEIGFQTVRVEERF